MWIIQNKIFGEETDLLKALEDNNIKYKLSSEVEDLDRKEKYFVRGSVEYVEYTQDDNYRYLNLTIGNYDCSSYYQYLRKFMLNYNFIILPWWALKDNKIGVFNTFPKTNKFFIRPNSGRKVFTGTTLTKKWWDKELEIIKSLPTSDINDDELVLISSYKEILSEFRVLVYRKEIIDWTCYSDNKGALSLETIQYFVNKLDNYPDPLYTMDIAHTLDNLYRILELNSAVSAGWYGMDYNKIVKRIENAIY